MDTETPNPRNLNLCASQVPDVSGMLHTSDFPCMKERPDVPDMQFRNLDIPVRLGSRSTTSPISAAAAGLDMEKRISSHASAAEHFH